MSRLLGTCPALLFAAAVLWAAAIPAHADESKRWSLHLGEEFVSDDVQNGVELSNNSATLGTRARLSFDQALSLRAGFAQLLAGSGGIEHWYFSGEYEHDFSDVFSATVGYEHNVFPNDSLNALAGLTDNVSLAFDVDLDPMAVTLSYEHYFGTLGADFLSLDLSGTIDAEPWTIVPVVSVTAMSQQVPVGKIKKIKSTIANIFNGVVQTQSVNGLSSVSASVIFNYDLGNNFSAFLVPTLSYTPKVEVSGRTFIPLITANIQYAARW